MRLIFDGHLDLALFAVALNRDMTEPVAKINERERGMTDGLERGGCTISLPEMQKARVAVCQSSIAARVNRDENPTSRINLDFRDHRMAYANGQSQLAYYRVLQEEGHIRQITDSATLAAHWEQWETGEPSPPPGVIVSMECADPIVRPSQAESWWEDGVRSVMLTHFGYSQYAAGTGVVGPVTPQGFELLDEFSRLGMILDVSHLCEESFYDAVGRFDGPLIASHNNCRAIIPGDRQLSDEQIKLIIDRGAVIGSVLDAWMLVPEWVHGKSTPGDLSLSAVVDHIDRVCELAGDSLHAAIGSDVGGTYHMPSDFRTTPDLHKMDAMLAARGYSDTDIDNIFHGNWLRFFRRHLPE
jgi:membrane dipeptidase